MLSEKDVRNLEIGPAISFEKFAAVTAAARHRGAKNHLVEKLVSDAEVVDAIRISADSTVQPEIRNFLLKSLDVQIYGHRHHHDVQHENELSLNLNEVTMMMFVRPEIQRLSPEICFFFFSMTSWSSTPSSIF